MRRRRRRYYDDEPVNGTWSVPLVIAAVAFFILPFIAKEEPFNAMIVGVPFMYIWLSPVIGCLLFIAAVLGGRRR